MKQCAICGQDIKLLSFKIDFDDGSVACATCAKKAGIKSNKDLEGLTLDLLKEWVDAPEKRQEYYKEQAEERKRKHEEMLAKQRAMLEQQEKEREERRLQEEAERKERERQKKEEAERKAKEQHEWELKHFPEGKIHTSVFEIDINNWSELDSIIQKVQDKGNEIIEINSTGVIIGGNTVPIIVSYRKHLK